MPADPALTDEPEFHQLVLLSRDAATPAPPGLTYVQLRHASARAVGELLSALYIPTGPTGTSERYALIYPTETELNAAATWARELDLASVDSQAAPPAEPGRAFAWAAAVLGEALTGDGEQADRLERAEKSFARAAAAADLSATRRWAAAMLAGMIRSDRLADYERAEQYFLSAEAAAPPDSLERMTAMYARARAHIQNGKPALARGALSDLAAQFDSFSATEVYARAAQARAELGGT